MKEPEQTGPTIRETTFTIRTLHCGSCRYLFQRQRTTRMNYFCDHPEAPREPVSVFVPDKNFIGMDDITPDWCPVSSTQRLKHK